MTCIWSARERERRIDSALLYVFEAFDAARRASIACDLSSQSSTKATRRSVCRTRARNGHEARAYRDLNGPRAAVSCSMSEAASSIRFFP